jgi:deoxyribonuclease V
MNTQDSDNVKNELINQVFDLKDAEKIQIKYSNLLKNEGSENFKLESWHSINYIAAVDITYFLKEKIEYGIACALLWDLRSNQLEEVQFCKDKINFPYIPGYLGFREVPLIVKSLKKLSLEPNIIMCDGHGIIHPKRFGEATHLGFSLNVPTFGVAKNPFVGKSNWKTIERKRGKRAPILENNELLGYAICLSDDLKPVFVSIGYRIDIDLSVKISLFLSKNHRQPEPLYLADKFSRKERLKEMI